METDELEANVSLVGSQGLQMIADAYGSESDDDGCIER